MKQFLLIGLTLMMVLCATFAEAMIIGKCHFSGEQPPHCMSSGQTTIYYHEMSSSSYSEGGAEYKQCTGDVWVIYRNANEPRRIQVKTTGGSVQCCYDF